MSVDVVGASGFGWYLKQEHIETLKRLYDSENLNNPEDFHNWIYDLK